jgi:hypothetical protein
MVEKILSNSQSSYLSCGFVKKIHKMYKCTGASVSCTQNIQKTQDNVKFLSLE